MTELLEILTELHEDVDFAAEQTLFDSQLIDSFDIVTIIAEVYDRFDITIPAEHITPANFNSARALWHLISQLMQE